MKADECKKIGFLRLGGIPLQQATKQCCEVTMSVDRFSNVNVIVSSQNMINHSTQLTIKNDELLHKTESVSNTSQFDNELSEASAASAIPSPIMDESMKQRINQLFKSIVETA